MPLRAIIFDVDGTLAETEETHRQAFNQAFAEAGKPWCWSRRDYAGLLTTTGGKERIRRYLAEADIVPDAGLIAALHLRKNQIYSDLVSRGAVQPRRGVLRLIEDARRHGITLAIATTTSRPNLAALLRHVFGETAMTWFTQIVTGEDVVAKKPDPEAYHRVLSLLRLDASECIAIEDSRNGLEAALACGLATVVTPSCYTQSQNFAGAARICASLEDDRGAMDVATLASILRTSMGAKGQKRTAADETFTK